jgi:hypothetical protein
MDVGINLDRRYLAAIALILLVAFAGGIKYQSYNESRRQEEQLLLEELNLPKSALEEQEQEEESLIQVYVCGEVKYPGIYQLKPGGPCTSGDRYGGGFGRSRTQLPGYGQGIN